MQQERITVTGGLFVGRKVGDLTVRRVEDLRSGRWVTFNDGSVRVFPYGRPVSA